MTEPQQQPDPSSQALTITIPTETPGPGRPSLYSEELAEKICDLLMEGFSLRSICALDSMPNRATIFRWLDKHDEFATKYARAREFQGDYMDDLILDTAQTCTEDNFKSSNVKIGAYQWRAEKLKPKKYGARIHQEVTGKDGTPLLSLAEAAKESARVMREAADPNLAAQVYADLLTGRAHPDSGA